MCVCDVGSSRASCLLRPFKTKRYRRAGTRARRCLRRRQRLAYTARSRLDPEHMVQIYSDLHRNILDGFNEYRVQIMTPAYERDTEQPKVVPRERWYEAPASVPAPPKAG